MIPSQNQQAHLADFAPKQSLDKYAKGADPRVINGIVALSEMQQQAAMRQQANLANGAAQGQMPTVRDKIMQMFQQANQPRQQPQQQPNPMQQGIMAQAHPQMQTAPMPQGEAPEEAQMYHGGVAHLPVNDRMFGYANGGIIAFRTGERPEDKEGYEDRSNEKLTPEEIKAQLDRIAANQGTPPERESEMMRAVKTPFRALGKGIKSLYSGTPNAEPTPVGAADQDLSAAITATAGTAKPATAPTAAPTAPTRLPADQAEHDRLDKIYKAQTTGIVNTGQKTVGGFTLSETIEKARERLEAEGKKLTPDDVRVIQRRFEGAIPDAGSGGIKTLPEAKPPAVSTTPPQRTAAPSGNATVNPNASAVGTGVDARLAQQVNRLATQSTGPQMPEPDVVKGGLKYLKAQDDYVRKTGDSEAAKKLYSLYDKMAQRALADDNAQAAQRAEDARNNLWSFLSNTRGSSLAVAAGKADAALQPLLSEQKKAASEYRKYSYERDMNREKARAEAMAAEEARKRGDFTKAIEYEKNERAYRLEAKKADDLAQHYRNTEINQALQIQATRETGREGHLTQLQVANINAAAQRAGFNKPSEAERVREEYNRIRTEKGQKAADEFLSDETKIRSAVGGAKYEGPDKSVQNRAKVYEILNKNESYTTAQETIRRLEAKTKRTPQEEQRLAQARKYTQDTFNNTYKGIYGTGPDADTGAAAPQRVTSQEEYSKLPSGTRFIAPDGSVRVKP